jgi:hypothetical protein
VQIDLDDAELVRPLGHVREARGDEPLRLLAAKEELVPDHRVRLAVADSVKTTPSKRVSGLVEHPLRIG